MVHAADCGITQNLDSPDLFEPGWAKNIIDAPIVDCCIAGCASEIFKVPEYMAVRFAIVFQIVSIEVSLVRRFEFKVEITCNENVRRLRSCLGPIDQCFGVGPSARSIESIGVRA
jgi:hypothetical protein